MKFFIILFFYIFLNNCSLNTNVKYWNEEAVNHKEIVNKNNEIQKKLPIILEKSKDITTMTLEEYEIYIDDYSKKSKYPDLSK